VSAVSVVRRVVLAAALLALAVPAAAQPLQVRGFFQAGSTTFTAHDSFKTVLGSATGAVLGGGGGVVIGRNIFVTVGAERFTHGGRRVFMFNGDVFDLGIESTVTITPVHLTGGYRYPLAGGRVVPYGGGGISWYRYQETDTFAQADEAADERFTGYHVAGGVEFPVLKWLAAAGEVQWTSVPDALGTDPASVSAAYDEHDLGGTTLRFKVIVGR
jgi:opacity protein-like surface antigen